MAKDRYRKVRRALTKIKDHIHMIEVTSHNRAERRRRLYEGEELKNLVENLKHAKYGVANPAQAEGRFTR